MNNIKTGETIILHDSIDLLKFMVNRVDCFALQHKDGGYRTERTAIRNLMFSSHLSGNITIGAYQFNQDNQVKWVCADIDSHGEDSTERDNKAETDTLKLCEYLTENEIPYLLEASGSKHSYHVWIFLVPVIGSIAKHFVEAIKNNAGIECEVFPKQNFVGKDGLGNLVKLPLATHQRHKGKSSILVNGEWTREVNNLEVTLVDLSNYAIPKEELIEINDKPCSMKSGGHIRPCIQNAIKLNLHALGDGRGQAMRVAIVREFWNSGMFSAEQLAMLFKTQVDFNYGISLYQVKSIIKVDFPNTKCRTLKAKCGSLLNCQDCKAEKR